MGYHKEQNSGQRQGRSLSWVAVGWVLMEEAARCWRWLRIIPPSLGPTQSLVVVDQAGMKSQQIIHFWLVKKLHDMTKVWQGKQQLWHPALRPRRNQPTVPSCARPNWISKIRIKDVFMSVYLFGGQKRSWRVRLIPTSLLILNSYWTFPRKPGSVLGAGVKSGRNAQSLSWWNL